MALTTEERNDLPDSAFAHIEDGGTKDGSGKTIPRSKRHFPIHDENHVRSALSQIAQGADFSDEAKPKVLAAAKKFGIEVASDSGKAAKLSVRDTAREHKSFSLKLDAPPDDQGHFTGYAAVYGNVDKGNDVIDDGAMTKTMQDNPDVPIFWVHDYGIVPIGMGHLAPGDSKGARIEGDLFLETSELAREVFGAMKAGAVKGLSVGYNTVKRSYKGAVRHLQEIKVGEVSLCPFPMNPLAEVDGLKAATRALAEGKDAYAVDSTMWAINSGSDFFSTLVQIGRFDIAEQIQAVIEGLASDLLSSDDADPDGDGDPDDTSDLTGDVPDETMSSIKSFLSALRSASEPATATRSREGAATSVTDTPSEPARSTLAALMADVKSTATHQ